MVCDPEALPRPADPGAGVSEVSEVSGCAICAIFPDRWGCHLCHVLPVLNIAVLGGGTSGTCLALSFLILWGCRMCLMLPAGVGILSLFFSCWGGVASEVCLFVKLSFILPIGVNENYFFVSLWGPASSFNFYHIYHAAGVKFRAVLLVLGPAMFRGAVVVSRSVNGVKFCKVPACLSV